MTRTRGASGGGVWRLLELGDMEDEASVFLELGLRMDFSEDEIGILIFLP